MEGIKSNVLEKKQCEVSIDIKIDRKAVSVELEKVFNRIQGVANIPGFRKGKAPIDLVKKGYSGKAREELINSIVPKAIEKVVEQENLEPVAYPSISDFNFKDDQAIEFKIMVETRPEFDVKDYKNLKIEKEKLEVVDSDVDQTLNYLIERNAKLVKDEATEVAKNSFVEFDYEGTIDGESFDGGVEKNSLISIEKSHFVPGYAEQMVGMKIGEEKDIKVTFPADYQKEELREKEAIFKVKINGLKKKEVPELNDEFAKVLGEDSLDTLKSKIKEQLLKEKENKVKIAFEDDIITKLLEKNKISVPKSIVDNQAQNMADRMKQYYGQMQQGMDENALKEKYKEEAEKQVKAAYVLNAIAKKENIKATDEDLEQEIQKALKTDTSKEKEVRDYFTKNKSNILSKLQQDKVFEFVTQNATIKEKKK